MRQYLNTVRHVLENGTRKENRTGVDTLSTFNHNYEIDLQKGFPLLTTKSISWKNIVIELLWFLSGQTDIAILKHHKCKFWDAWADPETGKVPSAYGSFWRHFPTHLFVQDYYGTAGSKLEPDFNDQIRWVLDEMKRNPMSRRMVVSAWAPGNAQTSKLPPCHSLFAFNVQNEAPDAEMVHLATDAHNGCFCGGYGRQVRFDIPNMTENSRPKRICPECLGVWDEIHGKPYPFKPAESKDPKRLCLHLTQRSADLLLGVPYNIASYSLLLELFAQFTGIQAGIFAHTLIDAHVYTAKEDGSMAEYDHVPALKEQLTRAPRPLPRLRLDPSLRDLQDVEALMDLKLTTEEVMSHFVLEGYDPWPALTGKVAV